MLLVRPTFLLRIFQTCAAMCCASTVFGQTPELPKPPAEGPLSKSPSQGLPLESNPIPGAPASGIPMHGVSEHSLPLVGNSQQNPGEAGAAETLVIFNSNDPDSGPLAQFYAEKRHIPKDQIIGLPCTRGEEIGRDEYDLLIADPLRKAFLANHWWTVRKEEGNPMGVVTSNHIRFVVLMRGMPLKILATTNYPGDKPSGPPAVAAHNDASLDSELAVLGVGQHPISGVLNNPYFRSYSRIGDAKQPEMMLVCRLDAPTPAIVRRMITDSLAAEQSGLHGMAYVDARGITDPGYVEGDQWLFALASNARRIGIPVVLDQGPGLFPDSYPMQHAAFYFGWYSETVTGPFLQPSFRFEPGAIAVHLHSFSASTLQDPHKFWCAPLLADGAAATLGNVYEPFLDLTPHLDIFFERLSSGFTFAESGYMSERVLSWMTTFIGDPLYRPFPRIPTGSKAGSKDQWALYREGAIKWHDDHAAGEVALTKAGNDVHSGVIFEGLGLLELTANARPEALDAFGQARKYYKDADDILRVTVHEVGVLESLKRHADAVALVRKQIEAFPKSRAVEVLRMLEPPTPEKH